MKIPSNLKAEKFKFKNSNLTEKKLSTVFSKFAVEKALMLEYNIAYTANWYFASNYVNCK